MIIDISCFAYGQPADVAHRSHLLDVVDYFIYNYPDIDGINLDFIRFDASEPPTTPSFENIDSVWSFVRELKNTHSRGLPIYVDLWTHANTYRELLLGQWFADLAAVSDYFCPMIYVSGSADAKDEIIKHTTRASLARTAANNLKIMPILQNYDPITTSELNQQILGCLESRADGVGFFRMVPTSAAEWAVIDGYTP